MDFNNRLYELRKRKGLSQEELAGRINVSRQTVSKWEVGDSTPDMEKMIALSDLFEISLDELVLGREYDDKNVDGSSSERQQNHTSEVVEVLEEKVFTSENKVRAKKWAKVAGIIFGIFVVIDVISMVVYFVVYGVPK